MNKPIPAPNKKREIKIVVYPVAYIGYVPANRAITNPVITVFLVPISLIKNGLMISPMTIPMFGIVLNVSTAARETPGNDEYIRGNTEEICGAIINNKDIDNKATLNNPDFGLTFFMLSSSIL